MNRLASLGGCWNLSDSPVATCGWRPEHDESVTGRPRCCPDYIKALKFIEKGYPHLHVLFFNVPKRESDGMPWLCDKPELAKKWSDYGQGEIVDAYPLVYRDDLDDLAPEFQDDEGFVDWYRFGEHDHNEEWIRERTRAHDLTEFDDETEEMESTAGAYLGKYLSATFGSLLDTAESFEEPNEENRSSFADKAATWKLALYWVTNRRFWYCSQSSSYSISIEEHLHDPAVRESIRNLSIDSIRRACSPVITESLARRTWRHIDALEAGGERAIITLQQDLLQFILPEEIRFRCVINYLGAFASWDLPAEETKRWPKPKAVGKH
ncbi:hypothetical protein HZS55_04175 [Halosimplex rubrum]|uniref:DUF8148 domain-containing protein n=1 Tax=Halosimplex rubrum TaxID=869889 RepID=A0A7D5SYS5_9EURY|nr:hypothetical protein [Halosimplex rubrum]QLH76548.1 hypothetical protein HZS55_04175 [Halosimplex rubrum]